MGAYPDGCTQAMHDRAHGGEERALCDQCNGVGCEDCNDTGFEQRIQAHERDYDPSEDADVDF